MNERPLERQILDLFRLLSSREDLTQRGLSEHLGISLGKTNYLLKELVKVGLLEIKNFTTRDGKLPKVKYHLTREGIEERLRLTYHFLKEKESEYYTIRKEWRDLNGQNSAISKEKK